MQFVFGFPEVLKQVWDLSDQDNDSMLSLREFCIALYLMERHREGRALPSVLPPNLIIDESPLPASGQPTGSHGATAWRDTPGCCGCSSHEFRNADDLMNSVLRKFL
ncbi:hypothetical protein HAX54_033225 [Datura stramonium]|uniref:Uncharacterized protein n=1 Tax=Datura stramonium TaxID=4076 RepID=A0ABS8VFR2_DATST|nr:hypothetical protein [Datura stramonium]